MNSLVFSAALLAAAHSFDPGARAIIDTALARMGGPQAVRGVERLQVQEVTEWQRTAFEPLPSTPVLAYELSTELRDYRRNAWRYERRAFTPQGEIGITDLVTDSVAAVARGGVWRPQNVAYVQERDEVFAFAAERVLLLARDAGDARAQSDTTVDGVRYARVSATVGRFHPTLWFHCGDGLLARAAFRVTEYEDFGLAPWGEMPMEILYSRWQRVAGQAVALPMQLDVRRVGRPYKRVTFISAAVNPTFAADTFAIADSIRAAYHAAGGRPMYDLPLDSARIVDGAFATFAAPGTPPGAIKVGGRWVMIEAGIAPLSLGRSAAWLSAHDPAPLAGVVITAPSGAGIGGVAWLAKQRAAAWVSDAARPYVDAALKGWKATGITVAAARAGGVIRVGADSILVATIDVPDYPGTTVLYVPSLRWLYTWSPSPLAAEAALALARRRGWAVDRIANARNVSGVAAPKG